MKETGEPDRTGEVRLQAGVTARAVKVGDELKWEILQHDTGEKIHRNRLAHVSHWKVP